MKPTIEQYRDALNLVLDNCVTLGHGDEDLDQAAKLLLDAISELVQLQDLRDADKHLEDVKAMLLTSLHMARLGTYDVLRLITDIAEAQVAIITKLQAGGAKE